MKGIWGKQDIKLENFRPGFTFNRLVLHGHFIFKFARPYIEYSVSVGYMDYSARVILHLGGKSPYELSPKLLSSR